MTRAVLRRVRVLPLVLFACGSSFGEELWISTAPAVPRPGQPVDVRLMKGDDRAGEEQAYDRSLAGRFQRIWRSGRDNLSGTDGATPAARFRPGQPGVQLLAYESRPSGGAGVVHYCKAVVVVEGAAAGSPLRWSELGHRLEIVPQTDPVELLEHGGSLEVQVLFEREPLARAIVHAVSESAPDSPETARTDEIGLARFRLNRAGWWRIRVARDAPCDERPGCASERLSATLTLSAGGHPVRLSRE